MLRSLMGAYTEYENNDDLRCAVLFALGGLQGVVGWWMVYSGLADRTEDGPAWIALQQSLWAHALNLLAVAQGDENETPKIARPSELDVAHAD